eukprot:6196479-Pleurochrysis_carterae.AAC.1
MPSQRMPRPLQVFRRVNQHAFGDIQTYLLSHWSLVGVQRIMRAKGVKQFEGVNRGICDEFKD